MKIEIDISESVDDRIKLAVGEAIANKKIVGENWVVQTFGISKRTVHENCRKASLDIYQIGKGRAYALEDILRTFKKK